LTNGHTINQATNEPNRQPTDAPTNHAPQAFAVSWFACLGWSVGGLIDWLVGWMVG